MVSETPVPNWNKAQDGSYLDPGSVNYAWSHSVPKLIFEKHVSQSVDVNTKRNASRSRRVEVFMLFWTIVSSEKLKQACVYFFYVDAVSFNKVVETKRCVFELKSSPTRDDTSDRSHDTQTGKNRGTTEKWFERECPPCSHDQSRYYPSMLTSETRLILPTYSTANLVKGMLMLSWAHHTDSRITWSFLPTGVSTCVRTS
jgi:hypothetical protein